MGKEQPVTYYDDVFRGSAAYASDPHAAPWTHLWREIAKSVGFDQHVFDLGCGPGHLAQMLAPMSLSYVGVDFSPVAIQQAKERCAHMSDVIFHVSDLRDAWLGDRARPPVAQSMTVTVVVCCEVLEHISFDLEVLAAVPANTRVVFTVPNFDDAGHVRHFATVAEVVTRYQRALDHLNVRPIGSHYFCEGVAP